MFRKKKSSKSTIILRIKEVEEQIIKGYRTHEIVQYSAKVWGIGERQTRKYISHANKKLERLYDKRVDVTFVKNEARLNELYRKAMFDKEYAVAKSVIRELNLMHGINLLRVDNTTLGKEINPVVFDLSGFSNQQLEDLISKLED